MASFSAPDGTTLTYDRYEPDGAARPRAAVLVLPGWADHAGRHAWLAGRLQDARLATYVVDLRGHGRSGGRRAHLSRFSQLLGDLQAFRREVRRRHDVPQVLCGHAFGGLVVLRYLETQPSVPPVAAIVSAPFLGSPNEAPAWQVLLGRLCADLWPTMPVTTAADAAQFCRDPAVNAAFAADPLVLQSMTAGAWHETQWAQRAVVADSARIECAVQFLLAGEDRIVDTHLARAFASALKATTDVRWYPEMYHEVFHDPQKELVLRDLISFLEPRV